LQRELKLVSGEMDVCLCVCEWGCVRACAISCLSSKYVLLKGSQNWRDESDSFERYSLHSACWYRYRRTHNKERMGDILSICKKRSGSFINDVTLFDVLRIAWQHLKLAAHVRADERDRGSQTFEPPTIVKSCVIPFSSYIWYVQKTYLF